MTILSTSSTALLAFQRALSTISHNVANANTEGYSRQTVELSTRQPQPFGNGFIGRGVQQDTVERLTDSFNFERMIDSRAEVGRLEQLNLLADRLDRGFTDAGSSLNLPWSQLFDSMQAVSTDPSSTAAREAMLASARNVAGRMRSLETQLQSYDREVSQRLTAGVERVNQLTSELGALNKEIGRVTGLSGGQPANDLFDQRDRLVLELSGLIGVNTALQDDGSLNVYTQGGQALLIGTTPLQLSASRDSFRQDRVNIGLQAGNTTVPLPPSAFAGELGGLMEFRDTVLDPASVSLGSMATTLAYTVNAVNAQGVDLYGNPGAPIFNQPTMTTLPSSSNTGGATISASIASLAAFDGRDVLIEYDGVGYTASDRRTGAALPIGGTGVPGDPLTVNGVAVVVSGAPAAGDRFLLQPASGAAGRIDVVMTDPRGIAAAAPLGTRADVGNLGTAQPRLTVTDRNAPGFTNPVDIQFLDSTTYTVNGGPPIAYAPGDTIAGNGWEITLEGDILAGDRFQVRATTPGSSDNGNMLVMASLDDTKLLFGGTGSLNESLRQMTTQVGAAARNSTDALAAQKSIDQQLIANRESVSGVNLDEEAANLLRFQQAYQASAQLMTVADTLFQSLLQATRR